MGPGRSGTRICGGRHRAARRTQWAGCFGDGRARTARLSAEDPSERSGPMQLSAQPAFREHGSAGHRIRRQWCVRDFRGCTLSRDEERHAERVCSRSLRACSRRRYMYRTLLGRVGVASVGFAALLWVACATIPDFIVTGGAPTDATSPNADGGFVDSAAPRSTGISRGMAARSSVPMLHPRASTSCS